MRIILFFILLTLGHLEAAVVHGVLFYGDSCTHCHELVEEEIPQILEKYGDRLDIRLVNVSTKEGHRLFESMLTWLDFPEKKAGIPAMIIGKKMLLGSIQIPKELPQVIEAGLSKGGIPSPEIPGLQPRKLRRLTLRTSLRPAGDDPVGNLIAIVLILVMVVSISITSLVWLKKGFPERSSKWTPLLAILGLSIAIYLSYLELTGRAGICGPIGDCDAVQQSPYSTILGIPVGLLGTLSYLFIIAFWFWQPKQWLLPLFLMVNTLFSVYLTFLEPFVIRAVCFWCLSSATIMTVLLWLHIPLLKKSHAE